MIDDGWYILGFLSVLALVVFLIGFMGYRHERKRVANQDQGRSSE